MKLLKCIYKITFKKSKGIWEIIAAIGVVTAMLVVFTNMAVSVSKAFLGMSMNSVLYDTVVYHLEKNEAESIYNEFRDLENTVYVFNRTDSIETALKDDPLYEVSIYGAQGDILDIYGYVLIEGRSPEEKNEIMLSKDYLSQLSDPIQVGDTVSLIVNDGVSSENVEPEYTFSVVGIFDTGIAPDYLSIEAYTTMEQMESIIGDRESWYSVCVYSDAASSEELMASVQAEQDILQKYGTEVLMESHPNEDRMNLYSEKGSNSSVSIVFYALSILIAVASLFMIYNLITATTNERIKTYGFLRSIGFSQKDILVNFIGIIFGTAVIGSLVGILLGFVFNHTIGRFLVQQLTRGLNSESIQQMILQDYASAYLDAVMLVFIVVTISNIMIWKKIQKYTIVEELKFGENTALKHEKTKNRKGSQITKKSRSSIQLIGNRNIKRNKVICRCTYINFFFVSLILVIVSVFFFNLKYSDFDTMKKALYCDYELNFDAIRGVTVDASQMKVIREHLGYENVNGICEFLGGYDIVTREESAAIDQRIMDESGVTQITDLSQEDRERLYELKGVCIYITDDEVIEELVRDSGLAKPDFETSLVYSNVMDSDEIVLYDIEDKQYRVELDGCITRNYMRNYIVETKYDLIMNWKAAQEYLGIQNVYTGMLVKSDLPEAEMEQQLAVIGDVIGVKIFFESTNASGSNVVNEGKMMMFIALYLVACLFVMVTVNNICIMRVSVKQRKQEYGIFMALGMTIKDIISLLSFETRKLCRNAILVAIPIGTVISIVFIKQVGNPLYGWRVTMGILITITIVYGSTCITTYLIGKKLVKASNIKAGLEGE